MTTPILNYGTVGIIVPPSGGFQQAGSFLYWPNIINLTGGSAVTDLDGQNISAFPANTMFEVTIAGRGASQWLRVQDATSPVTNLDAGIITPVNYDVSLRPYVLNRQLGY